MNGNSNTTVINTEHTNNGVWHWDGSVGFTLMIALRKLIAPRIEETPTKCREPNRKGDGSSSMSSVSWQWSLRSSACSAPVCTTDANESKKERGRNPKLLLLIRVKLYWVLRLSVRLVSFQNLQPWQVQLWRKRLTEAWAVTAASWTWASQSRALGWPNSACISWLKGEPTVPAQAPMNKHRGTSQVAEWIRICLPMHGKWVQSLVQEQEWNKLYVLRALKALGSGKIGMRGRVYVEIAVNIGRKVICCVCSSYCLWRGICLMM